MPITKMIGLFLIPLLLGVGFFNGVVMVISPVRWFMLPRYIALRGTLRQHTYTASRAGRLQIRAVGLIFASATGWMMLSFFVTPYPGGKHLFGMLFDWWLCLATCIGAISCGLAMLFKPSWWIGKYLLEARGEGNQAAFEWT